MRVSSFWMIATVLTLAALVIVLWIAAIWSGDGRLAGTGGILCIPTLVLAVAIGIRSDNGL